MSSSQETITAKRRAALTAARLVKTGMTVGLGTGTTASLIIRALGDRVAEEGLKFVAVPTSVETAELASSLSIPLRELDDVDSIDINLDGADEVDADFRMIKGRGGALLREKLTVTAALRRITVITQEKRVTLLGQHAPIPVEVSPVGARHTLRRLEAMGASATLRLRADRTPAVSDGGNRIIDCRFHADFEPVQLDAALKQIVGVFETGLFLGLCDLLIIGTNDGVEELENHSSSRS